MWTARRVVLRGRSRRGDGEDDDSHSQPAMHGVIIRDHGRNGRLGRGRQAVPRGPSLETAAPPKRGLKPPLYVLGELRVRSGPDPPTSIAYPQSSTADPARACPLDRRDWRAGTGATTGSRTRCRRSDCRATAGARRFARPPGASIDWKCAPSPTDRAGGLLGSARARRLFPPATSQSSERTR